METAYICLKRQCDNLREYTWVDLETQESATILACSEHCRLMDNIELMALTAKVYAEIDD